MNAWWTHPLFSKTKWLSWSDCRVYQGTHEPTEGFGWGPGRSTRLEDRAYRLSKGAILSRMEAFAKCGTRNCIAPDHLWLRRIERQIRPPWKARHVITSKPLSARTLQTLDATQAIVRQVEAEFAKLRAEFRGRPPPPPATVKPTMPTADKSANREKYRHKLSVEDVSWIKARLAAGELQCDVARSFQIHPVTVGSISRGKIWKNVRAAIAGKRGTAPFQSTGVSKMTNVDAVKQALELLAKVVAGEQVKPEQIEAARMILAYAGAR